MRPLHDPMDEPMTFLLNGVVDERNWKEMEVEHYSEENAKEAELIVNNTHTCILPNNDMEPRMSPVAAYLKGSNRVRLRDYKTKLSDT